MNRVKRPRLLILGGGGIAALALAGTIFTGSAFAAGSATPTATQGTQTGTTTTQTSKLDQFEQRLAQNLGLNIDQLKSAVQKTQDQSVDDAVASGKLTQAQGDSLKRKIDSGQAAPFIFDGGFGGRHGGPGGTGFGHDGATVASTLGITEQQLQSELQSGTALKDVITNHGKTVDDVVTAVVNQEKTELDQAVSSGKLTSDQESQQLANLKQQLTNAINNNTLPGPVGGPMGGHMGGHGMRGGNGQQSGSQNPNQSATPTG